MPSDSKTLRCKVCTLPIEGHDHSKCVKSDNNSSQPAVLKSAYEKPLSSAKLKRLKQKLDAKGRKLPRCSVLFGDLETVMKWFPKDGEHFKKELDEIDNLKRPFTSTTKRGPHSKHSISFSKSERFPSPKPSTVNVPFPGQKSSLVKRGGAAFSYSNRLNAANNIRLSGEHDKHIPPSTATPGPAMMSFNAGETGFGRQILSTTPSSPKTILPIAPRRMSDFMRTTSRQDHLTMSFRPSLNPMFPKSEAIPRFGSKYIHEPAPPTPGPKYKVKSSFDSPKGFSFGQGGKTDFAKNNKVPGVGTYNPEMLSTISPELDDPYSVFGGTGDRNIFKSTSCILTVPRKKIIPGMDR
eukprot:TRINITY_DN1674_c0_g1_i1.p1 TRINITY_DN1674_c0_g1~~TRINITY_DN1674_c0_g1_i1.p1  ORF type:complete len:352 (-),score=67.49 TRINITY_DN1674_c0_g1_i1:274-1329(-)